MRALETYLRYRRTLRLLRLSETFHILFSGKNLQTLLQDPARILNCDETGIQLAPGKRKVLTYRGMEDVYCIQKSPT